MNDVEIKDIDKLKNLLIEFGVEFEAYDTNITLEDRGHYISFNFVPSGKYIDFVVD